MTLQAFQVVQTSGDAAQVAAERSSPCGGSPQPTMFSESISGRPLARNAQTNI
jgi:hypothetical protein